MTGIRTSRVVRDSEPAMGTGNKQDQVARRPVGRVGGPHRAALQEAGQLLFADEIPQQGVMGPPFQFVNPRDLVRNLASDPQVAADMFDQSVFDLFVPEDDPALVADLSWALYQSGRQRG